MGFAALTAFFVIVIVALIALPVWIYLFAKTGSKGARPAKKPATPSPIPFPLKRSRGARQRIFPLLLIAQAKPQLALILGGVLVTTLAEALRAGLAPEARGGVIGFSIAGILFFLLGLVTINRSTPPKSANRVLAAVAKWLAITPTQLILLVTSLLLAGIAISASGDELLMRVPLVALIAWVLSVALALLGAWPLKTTGKPFSWIPFLIAAGLALLALLLRGVNAQRIPNTLTGDEASAGLFAVDFIQGRVNNIFSFGWYSFPALYFYVQAISISIFGQTTQALRLTSALAGALTVGAVYLAGRAMYGRITGLFAVIFLAGLHFHIHFSRIGLNNIWDGFWFTVILGLVWWAWKHERREAFLLAGLALGLSQYDYVSVRLLFLLIPAWLLVPSLADRRRFRRNRAAIILMFLIAIIVVLPMAANYAKHVDQFMAPMNRVSLLGPWLQNEMQKTAQPAWRILAEQIWISVQAFTNADLRAWYTPGTPILRSFAAGFFLLGIALMAFEWRKPRHWLLLFWLGAFVLSGGLSESTPAAQRYIGAAPAAAIVLGYALSAIGDRLTKALDQDTQVFAAIGLITVILLAASDINFYFNDFTPRGEYSGPNNAVAQHLADYLQTKPPGVQVVFFGQPRMGYRSIPSILYLAPEANGLDMVQPLGSPENPGIDPGLVLFVFLPGHETDLQNLQTLFPDQPVHQELGIKGDLLYWSVEFQNYPNG